MAAAPKHVGVELLLPRPQIRGIPRGGCGAGYVAARQVGHLMGDHGSDSLQITLGKIHQPREHHHRGAKLVALLRRRRVGIDLCLVHHGTLDGIEEFGVLGHHGLEFAHHLFQIGLRKICGKHATPTTQHREHGQSPKNKQFHTLPQPAIRGIRQSRRCKASTRFANVDRADQAA